LISSPVLEFRSAAFPVTLEEEQETTTGISGMALSDWVAAQLRARGHTVGEVIPRDIGWCVPVESPPHTLYVTCAGTDDQNDGWRIYVHIEGGLLARLFRKDRRREEVAAVYAVLKQSLQAAGATQMHEVSA
jgi:hypothetical protein